MIAQDELRSILSYDPATGDFTWLINSRGHARAGDIAGTIQRKGYRAIKISGRLYQAHRLAWLYVHGRWPTSVIDHANGVPDDNRLCNLREATHAENQQNRLRAQVNNRCGLLGVSPCGKTGRFRARIRLAGKEISLGAFKTAEEASAAYVKAKAEIHPFSNTNSIAA